MDNALLQITAVKGPVKQAINKIFQFLIIKSSCEGVKDEEYYELTLILDYMLYTV